MQPNYLNTNQPQYCMPQGPNAVSINIYSPTAYGSGVCPSAPQQNTYSCYPNSFYPVYGQNQMPNMPYYPMNYNNMVQQQPYAAIPNGLNAISDNNIKNSSNIENTKTEENSKTKKEEKKKTYVPLTDDYIKSLENYMNNENPKVRLIAVKEIMQRFKEDENRKDNPPLMPLLNKALRDTSAAVRFLALTTLQLGYSVGNDETVQILKEIESSNKDKIGEDSLLASEILLKMSAPAPVEKKKAGSA